jgi:hypothetical protein
MASGRSSLRAKFAAALSRSEPACTAAQIFDAGDKPCLAAGGSCTTAFGASANQDTHDEAQEFAAAQRWRRLWWAMASVGSIGKILVCLGWPLRLCKSARGLYPEECMQEKSWKSVCRKILDSIESPYCSAFSHFGLPIPAEVALLKNQWDISANRSNRVLWTGRAIIRLGKSESGDQRRISSRNLHKAAALWVGKPQHEALQAIGWWVFEGKAPG